MGGIFCEAHEDIALSPKFESKQFSSVSPWSKVSRTDSFNIKDGELRESFS